MKRLILLCFLSFSFWSCSLDSDTENFYNVFVPIESVTIPESFTYGVVHSISFSYYRPSTCHFYQDLYYVADDNTRTVAVINTVYEKSNCELLTENLIERSFDFKPLDYGSYVFKFWTGVNENDEDEFIIYEIVVAE
jgi:hypothetical protein